MTHPADKDAQPWRVSIVPIPGFTSRALPLACVNCGRPIEPDGEDWGHVAAALREGDNSAREFWSNPCADPDPLAPIPPELG